nr:amidohydrolase family protein [uncultured Acetatifactor sp.]
MITATPAAILGLERETGSVKVGRKADLVLFDRDVHIRKVFRNGILQYAE